MDCGGEANTGCRGELLELRAGVNGRWLSMNSRGAKKEVATIEPFTLARDRQSIATDFLTW